MALGANWPGGPAPCNTTLQACVDGSPEFETIYVNTNNTIDETIATTKAVSLIAGNGYKPVFANGRHIEMTSTASSYRTVIIEGLTLTRGRIAYNHQAGATADVNLIIRKNTILGNSFTNETIRVLNQSTQNVDLKLDYNQLRYERTGIDTSVRGAIALRAGFTNGSSATGTVTGRIYGNTITTNGPSSIGIGIFGYSDTSIELDIAGNEITGGNTGGVYAYRIFGSGSTDLNIANNAFYQFSNGETFKGVYLDVFDGTLYADIVNNTTLQAFDGFRFNQATGASLNVDLYNNIMAFGSAAVYTDSDTTLNNDYNLLYMNSFNDADFTPGTNHIATNPMVMGMHNARLRPDSPAIEAGNGLYLLLVGATPFVDADGTIRIKKGDDSVGSPLVDMGAYETGDLFFTHLAESSGSHISTIDHDGLNDQASLDDVHITANWNPPGSPGVYNDENEGIYYASGFWRVFNEGLGDINLGAAFNVHKYASSSNTFEHQVTSSGNNNTVIDHSSLNNQSDRIVQVTQHWTGTYNPHPFGVLYFGGSWVIANLDLSNIPINSNFNVYSQTPSKSAWRHIASAANTFSQITYLDNPLINDVACAELQVTQSANQGVFNDAPIGVYYEAGRWSIYNQDLSTMPANAEFHITVNPEQIAACSDLIFENGFE